MPIWPEYLALRDPRVTGERLEQAILIERAWASWYDAEYTVGPDYVASWEDRPMGFAMFKIFSINSFIDRCAIENSDNPSSYTLFDLASKTVSGKQTFITYDIHEYHLSDQDEMMIRLSL